MSTEKILLDKGRVAVHFVKPRRGTKRYFECFYLIPTILTYTLNTYSSGKKYYFTRYTGVQFLWWAIEVSMEYGEVKEEKIKGFTAIKEAMENLRKAIGGCAVQIRAHKTHRDIEYDFTNDLINNTQ